MRECEKCGNYIPRDVFTCPHCGVIGSGWPRIALGIAVLVIAVANVEEYYKIRDAVKSVEVLRRSAENLMRDSTPKQGHKRDDVSL